MKKIVLISWQYAQGIGDRLVSECNEYLFRECLSDADFVYTDLFAREKEPASNRNDTFAIRCYRKGLNLLRAMGLTSAVFNARFKIVPGFRKQFENDFQKMFQGADLIVISGGGLIKHNAYLDMSVIFEIISKVSLDMDIPLAINAVGIEGGFSLKKAACRRYQKALTGKNVIEVTARDNFEELQQYMQGSAIPHSLIADSGVWAAEMLGISPDMESKTIGIGVITPVRFAEEGRDFSEDNLTQLYLDLISEVEKKGFEWKLFSNGLDTDHAYAEKLIKLLGKDPEQYLAKRPFTSKELISIEGGFCGVIAARLHALIIAYSLAIPFIGISWNDKTNQFADAIGYPDRIFGVDSFDPAVMVEQMIQAVATGYEAERRDAFRRTSKEFVARMCRKIR